MNDLQVVGLLTLPFSFVLMILGIYSDDNDSSFFGLLIGGLLFLLSLVILFIGFVVLEC